VFFKYIEKAPSRSQIRETLTNLWTYPKEGLPKKRGNNYFLNKNSGIQNQWYLFTYIASTCVKLNDILWCFCKQNDRIVYKGSTVESLYGDDSEVFLNPNEFSKDGTVSLKVLSISNLNMYVYLKEISLKFYVEIFIF
jgi:prolyl oligopeptidase